MTIKKIFCSLLTVATLTASAQIYEDSASAAFFRDFYHQGHLAHWLDALSDHIFLFHISYANLSTDSQKQQNQKIDK